MLLQMAFGESSWTGIEVGTLGHKQYSLEGEPYVWKLPVTEKKILDKGSN